MSEDTVKEIEAKSEPLPAPEDYRQAYSDMRKAVSDERKGWLKWLESPKSKTDVGKWNALHRQTNDAKARFGQMQKRILSKTNAAWFRESLVMLEEGESKKGNKFIKVAEVYSHSEFSGNPLVKRGDSFLPDLGNAPERFREAMYRGPFLINFDGTLDVSQRYDQIPFTKNPIFTTSNGKVTGDVSDWLDSYDS